jgi:outer membrane lipoprotein SlyB
MKTTNTIILSLAGVAVLLTGCQNPDGTQNNTGSGALIGGAFGALTGAAIGGRRNGGLDALIGAGAGALAGGLVGNSMDREQEARLKAEAPQTYVKVDQGQPLAIPDIKAMATAKVSDDVIIAQIVSTHSIFHLAANDIIDLRNSGVSDRVVNFMINSPTTVTPPAAPVIYQAPPPTPTETVVAAPGPDYVWVDGEWEWGGAGWVWVGGHWMHPPYAGVVWVRGYSWHDRWGWHYERGHWR